MADLGKDFSIAHIRDAGTAGGPEALVDLLIEAGKVKLEEAQNATQEILTTYFKQEGEEFLFNHRGFWAKYFGPSEAEPETPETSEQPDILSGIGQSVSEYTNKFFSIEKILDQLGEISFLAPLISIFRNLFQMASPLVAQISSKFGTSQTQNGTETEGPQEPETETEIAAGTTPEVDPEKEATLAAARASEAAAKQFADNAPGTAPAEPHNQPAPQPAPGLTS